MSTSPIDDIENRIIEDDDNDFRKVTLTEKHIPDKNGFKTCGVCGMRLRAWRLGDPQEKLST